MNKTITCAILLGLLSQLSCTESAPNNNQVTSKRYLTTFGPSVVQKHSNQPLAPRVSEAFSRAVNRGDGAFGAFYIRPDGGSWATVTGRFSEVDAKRMAKIDCDIVSGEDCILYATFGPRDKPTEHTIPNNHKSVLATAKSDTAPGNFLAVASNPAGYAGFGVNYATQAEAKNSAMKACAETTQTALANEEARFRSAYKAAGLLECKVFGVYR